MTGMDQAIFLSRCKSAVWVCVIGPNAPDIYTTEKHSINMLQNVLSMKGAYGYAIHVSALSKEIVHPSDDHYTLEIARFMSTKEFEEVNLRVIGTFSLELQNVDHLALVNALSVRKISIQRGWLPK